MPRTKRYIVRYGEDEPFEIVNLAAFCREHDIKLPAAYAVINGKQQRTKGWKIFKEGEGPSPGSAPVLATAPPPESALDLPALPKEAKGLFSSTASPQEVMVQLRRYAADVMEREAFYLTNPHQAPEGWDAKKRMAVLEAYAKMAGVDIKKIGDTRDPGDKALDASSRLITHGGGEMLALLEEELDAIEDGMERCRKLGIAEMAELDAMARGPTRGRMLGGGVENAEQPAGPKEMAEAASRWTDCLRRVRTLRHLAHTPYDGQRHGWPEAVQRGTHLLRFMLYVGRSDLQAATPAGKVYVIGAPQVKMSMALHLSRAGYGMCDGVGLLAPGDRNPKTGGIFHGLEYSGCLIMAPPRHTKSDMMKHYAVLEIDLKPTSQTAYVTSVDDLGSTMLKSAAEYFNPSASQGRRNLSLFPHELADYDNNATSMRVKAANPPRQPQLIGHGVFTSRQGINLDLLILDDPVTKVDRTSQTERDRRVAAFKATWQTRLQGDSPFMVITGYPHHYDDLMWTMKKRADLAVKSSNADGMTLWQCIMPVGGPNSSPKFKSIWPEMYDSAYLARKYRDLNDVTMWAANYMLLPITETDRLVSKLRLYDCESEEHMRFLEASRFYPAVDPAAKGDGSGDKAGLVVGAEGDAIEHKTGPAGVMIESETQLRIVLEDEFHATQMELNQRLVTQGMVNRVDTVYIEQVTGLGSAMAEVLREVYGITSVETEGVKNMNKEARLRSVAPLVEDGSPGLRAKVLFPGIRKVDPDSGEERLVLHPSMERLANYVLNFAVTTGHHSLDAFTLLVRKRMQYLGAGQGAFSREAKESAQDTMDPRLRRLFDKAASGRRNAGTFRRVITHSGV